MHECPQPIPILLGIIVLIAALYYFFSTPGGNDLVLVGTVDANQIVVSPQIERTDCETAGG